MPAKTSSLRHERVLIQSHDSLQNEKRASDLQARDIQKQTSSPLQPHHLQPFFVVALSINFQRSRHSVDLPQIIG